MTASSAPPLDRRRPTGQLRTLLVDLSALLHGRIGFAAALFLALSLTASDDEGVVLCPFRRCTGGYCPGCGTTRAAGRLLRGDLVGSWQRHPYVVIAVGQLVVLGGLRVAGLDRLLGTIRRNLMPLLLLNGGLVLGIWLTRLLTGAVPIPFG